MDTFESFRAQLYSVNDYTFGNIALQLFQFQAAHNAVYRSFLHHLGTNPSNVKALEEIPFMPISFFKHQVVKTGAWPEEVVFTSSGTTAATTSAHYVQSVDFYLTHTERCFGHFFGPINEFHVLALLPSYLERQGSSLVAMVDHFIKKSGSPHSGFYLHNVDQMIADLESLRKTGEKVVLFGVTFALLDLAEKYALNLENCILIETGGMKGRRREIIRRDLHKRLLERLRPARICSEYGMTELLSQAYSENEVFRCPPYMRIIGRDLSDPLSRGLLGQNCGINVIDLANIHSVAFIETEDLGVVNADGSFEILGRIDNSDVRGCNLLIN